jgi:branched-chain amino acid transport system permease protein
MVLEDYFSKLSPTFWQFGIGLLLVLAVLFARRGVLGLFEQAGVYFGKGKKDGNKNEGKKP